MCDLESSRARRYDDEGTTQLDVGLNYEVVVDPGARSSPRIPDSLFRHLFEASVGYMLLLDADGRVVEHSAAVGALAVGAGPVIGCSLPELPWWTNRERIAQAIAAAQGGQSDHFVTPILTSDRSALLRVEVQAMGGPAGEDWFMVEARDVTDLVQSERQLRMALAEAQAEHGRLQAILDASPGFVAAVDADGRVTAANEAWMRWAASLAGRPVGVGDEVWDVYGPDHQHLADAWSRALRGETFTSRQRVPRPGSVGHQPVDLSFAPVRSEGGVVLGAVCIGHDVSERVEAERLRAGLEGADVGTFMADLAARTVRLSGRLRTLLALPDVRETVPCEKALSFVDDASAVVRAFEAAASGGAAVDVVVEVNAPQGRRWVRLRGQYVPGDPAQVVGAAYDVTDIQSAAGAEDRWAELTGWGTGSGHVGETVATEVEPEPALDDSDRIASLRRTGLLDSAPDESFDRLTRLVSQALGVPISLVSLVDEDRQFFKSQVGLSGWAADDRETPLSHSFCQHVAAQRRPLRVVDARHTPLVQDNEAIEDLGVVAYLGVPIAAPDGHVIGSLCAIDDKPHEWTEDDLRMLSGLAEVVTAEVALHQRRAAGDSGVDGE